VTYGYGGELLLISEIETPSSLESGQTHSIRATIHWLECEEICIPGQAELVLDMSVRDETPKIKQAHTEVFKKTRAEWPMKLDAWRASATKSGARITLSLESPDWFGGDFSNIEFFPFTPTMIEHNGIQNLKKTSDGYEIVFRKSSVAEASLKRLEGTLVNPKGWCEDGKCPALLVEVDLKAGNENIFQQMSNLIGQLQKR